MKRFLSTIVTIAIFFSGCAQKTGRDSSSLNRKISDDTESIAIGQPFDDEIYATLDAQPCLDGYEIDEISSMYMSKEYVEEKIYNSRENIYYGYTLQEIEWSFEGDRYVFAPDGEGHTIVKEFEVYEDPFEELFRNVCVGSGVILVCVTLSAVTGVLGMPMTCAVFAFAAHSATTAALKFTVMGAAISGAITAYKTGDFEEVLKSMAIGGSRGYKAGAIIGAITGTYSAAKQIRYMRNTIPSPREAELFAQTRYSGEEQVSFLNGKVVPGNTMGATRPDLVRMVDGHLEAIEVKRYDLENHLDELLNTLHNQVGSRVVNLPAGSTQRIVLDVQGRGYSEAFLDEVVDTIQWKLDDVYPNIPVDIQGWVP